MTEWRPVPGHPDFEVSELGEIRSAATKRPATRGTPSDSGYQRARLNEKLVRVHRVVLLAFRGPPPSARHVGAHDNGDKTDNRLANLLWKLPEANEDDKRRHGTISHGRTGNIPSPQVVGRVRAALDRGESFSRVALRFGLHRSTVSRYARGLRRAR